MTKNIVNVLCILLENLWRKSPIVCGLGYGHWQAVFLAHRQKQIENLRAKYKNLFLTAGSKRSEGRQLNSPTMVAPAANLFSSSSSSPLPATKNRKLRSEECVLHWRHVTWLFTQLQTVAPCCPPFGHRCSFKQLRCLQKKKKNNSFWFLVLYVIPSKFTAVIFLSMYTFYWMFCCGSWGAENKKKTHTYTHKCWSFTGERFKPRGTNCLSHLKSGPERAGPSIALYWVTAERIEIPPSSS